MRLRRQVARASVQESAHASSGSVEPDQTESDDGFTALDVRQDGPWDRSEKAPSDRHLDFGSLLVRGRIGLDLQIPAEADGSPAAVVLFTEDSALELRAFAAPRSGGLWHEVYQQIVSSVAERGGEAAEVAGRFGTELHVQVPVQTAEGVPAIQPSRILGIEGPRWLLRATFLGQAALEPSDEGILAESLRDVIVVRGPEPRMSREALAIELDAVLDAAKFDEAEPDEAEPDEAGPDELGPNNMKSTSDHGAT